MSEFWFKLRSARVWSRRRSSADYLRWCIREENEPITWRWLFGWAGFQVVVIRWKGKR